MGEYTSHFNLYKPNIHELNWGDTVNTNFDKIDTALQEWDNALGGDLSMDLTKIRGNQISINAGTADTGTQRITIATDDINLSGILSLTSSLHTDVASIKNSFVNNTLPVTLKLADGTTTGIASMPVYVDFAPSKILYFRQMDASGNSVAYNTGTLDASTQRITIATDDLVSSNIVKLGSTVVTGGGVKVNLRDAAGSQVGTSTNPIYITGAVTTPSSVTYDTGSGAYTSSTMRLVTATNDPNLAAIKAVCEDEITHISQSVIALGEVISYGMPALFKSPASKALVPLCDANGNVCVVPAGNTLPVTLRNSANYEVGTTDIPLKVMLVSDPTSSASTNVNIAKINGSTIDTNAGNASAASQRVTIATDDINMSAIKTGIIDSKTAILKITDDTTGYLPAMITNQSSILTSLNTNGIKIASVTNTVPVQLSSNLGTSSNPLIVQQQTSSGTDVNPWMIWHSFFAQAASCYTIATPYAIRQLSTDSAATQNVCYVLTSRQFSKYIQGGLDSSDWVIPSSTTNATRQVNFIFDEIIKTSFTVPRRIRFKTTINSKSEISGSATTISEVKLSLFKLTGADSTTELASYTASNLDYTTTNTEFGTNDAVIMGMFVTSNTSTTIATTDTIGMSVRITVTTGTSNGDVRIKHATGTNQTYVEFLNTA